MLYKLRFLAMNNLPMQHSVCRTCGKLVADGGALDPVVTGIGVNGATPIPNSDAWYFNNVAFPTFKTRCESVLKKWMLGSEDQCGERIHGRVYEIHHFTGVHHWCNFLRTVKAFSENEYKSAVKTMLTEGKPLDPSELDRAWDCKQRFLDKRLKNEELLAWLKVSKRFAREIYLKRPCVEFLLCKKSTGNGSKYFLMILVIKGRRAGGAVVDGVQSGQEEGTGGQ